MKIKHMEICGTHTAKAWLRGELQHWLHALGRRENLKSIIQVPTSRNLNKLKPKQAVETREIRAEFSEIETSKTIEKKNQWNRQEFLKNISKVHELLSRPTKKKEVVQINNIWNEKELLQTL